MKKLLLPVLIFTAAAFFSSVPAAKPKSDRILFVNLKLVEGQVYLESTKVVKGTLKKSKDIDYADNDLRYKVLSSSGTILYEGAIPDPSVLRLEYVDEQGQLQQNVSVLKTVDFAIRVPFDDDARRVIFYKRGKADQRQQSVDARAQHIGDVRFEVGGDLDEE